MEAQGDGCIEVEWYLAELAIWQVIGLERPAKRITGLHTSLPQRHRMSYRPFQAVN